MRLKKAMVKEEEDLEVLSRAIGVQQKMWPKPSEQLWDNFGAVLRSTHEQFFPPGTEKSRLPPDATE